MEMTKLTKAQNKRFNKIIKEAVVINKNSGAIEMVKWRGLRQHLANELARERERIKKNAKKLMKMYIEEFFKEFDKKQKRHAIKTIEEVK